MYLGTLLSLAVAAVGAAVPNGQTLSLNGIPYYLSGIAVSTLQGHNSSLFDQSLTEGIDIVPLTVIPVTPTTQISSLLSDFTERDDVFQAEFLRTVLLTSTSGSKVSISDHASTLKSEGTKLLLTGSGLSASSQGVVPVSSSQDLPAGPYFVSASTGKVFRAYRLYPDDNVAFIQAAISDEDGGFLPMPAVTENAMTKDVAVPSRLYYTPTAKQPLAGLRLGVKDIFHVEGLKTSGGSRSYYYLYGTQNATAPSIHRLIDLGAVFVGKTGTVQFANGDRPTADWVDFHCPFNPRGDGYQSPSGSSSGSGAAIASYSWLDIAVGSDTGGSMRSPASVQGVYGNRPSTGAISLEHVLPLSPELDTAGIFARTAALWSRVTQAWYPHFRHNYTSLPRHVYLGGDGWDGQDLTPEAHGLLNTFVQDVDKFLKTNHTVVDISKRWNQTHSASTPSLENLLDLTYATITSVDQYNHLATPLFADYAAAHRGRQPFINPGPLSRWTWGQSNGGNASYEVALRNMTQFRDWWETDGYGRSDEGSCSEGLFVSIYSAGETDYRNRYYEPPEAPPLGFSVGRIAVFTGSPEVVVPLGESPYNSTISLKTEYLPVSVALQMARGCDHVLADLVAGLGKKGILKDVGTGSRLYSKED
ncbi:putative amidase [Aspergillus steynii IBT 23096]|uniref:Putative amidase n=1 Tax=Aspergillus steynii IBT 23096 TaxID=1392250 RepID=A0A2I2G0W3_9EURO|nr:putative amidase [Aspergillus steynii IBT 23096]PLB46525.1 putative amidase [Aspergillus steynii IBT 23096]